MTGRATDWSGGYYVGIHLTGADGFMFVTVDNNSIDNVTENNVMLFLPKHKRDCPLAIRRALACHAAAIQSFLRRTLSSSFCIGYNKNHIGPYYIGTRKPQDIFKLLLKVPTMKRVTSWPSNIEFAVIVAKDDDYIPQMNTSSGVLQ